MKRWGIVAITSATLLVVVAALWSVSVLPTKKGAEEAPAVDTSPHILPGSAGTLTAWVYNGTVPGAAWERIAQEFGKPTGLLVKVTVYESEDSYKQALRRALINHTPPDIFLIESIEAETLRQAGQLAMLDVTPHDSTEWLPAALAPFRRDDKTVAFPSDFNLLVLYYNRAAFDRKGLGYPDVHWKWSTMLSISQALFRPPADDQPQPIYGIELPWGLDLWQAWACQAEGSLYDGSSWQAGNPKYAAGQLKALTFLRDLVRNYIVSPRPPSLTTGKLFQEQRAMIAISGAELMHELRQRSDLRWGIAPLPWEDKRATVLQARGWAVSALSAHPNEAAQLARAFASQPTRADWLSADVGGNPTHPADEQVFYDSAAYAKSQPIMTTAPEIKKMIDEEMNRWIQTPNASPAELMDWIQKIFPH